MTKGNVIVPAALIREAESVDREIRATWAERSTHEKAVNKIDVKLGRLWRRVEARGLHKYVHKAGSRKGYASLEEYARSITGQKHTAFFLSKTMASLTEGSNPIPDEQVAAIGPRKSAILAKVPEERRTPELVAKAKSQPEPEFTRTAQAAINADMPLERQRVLRIDFFRRLHPTVHDKLEGTIELYTRLKAVRMVDPDSGLTLQEKAILSLCAVAEGWAHGEECVAREKAIDLGPQEPTEAQESAEENPEAIEADAIEPIPVTEPDAGIEEDESIFDADRDYVPIDET